MIHGYFKSYNTDMIINLVNLRTFLSFQYEERIEKMLDFIT